MTTKIEDITPLMKCTEKCYAHIADKAEPELLEEHLRLTVDKFHLINEQKGLKQVWKNFKNAFGLENLAARDLFDKLLINGVYFHDIGKAQPYFQYHVMQNAYFKEKCTKSGNTKHSLFSAVVYIDHFFQQILDLEISDSDKEQLIYVLIINAYVLAKHHTGTYAEVTSIDAFKDKKGFLHEFRDDLNNFIEGTINENEEFFCCFKQVPCLCLEEVELLFNITNKVHQSKTAWEMSIGYIYARLVYSCIVSADIYATVEYSKATIVDDIGVFENRNKWNGEFEQNPIYKSIMKYKKERKNIDLANVKDINILRSEMFLESVERLLEQKENIVFLESPTGSGKTNTSLNLVLKWLCLDESINKIFYIFPYNTLVEQTKSAIYESFNFNEDITNQIAVINSVTPIECKEDSDEAFSKVVLERDFLHYPMVLTSHVKLSNTLFNCSKKDVAALYQLANSVLVIDEVQTYRNALWDDIIAMLKQYSDLLNIKIIIMSATLPRLGEMLLEMDYVSYLVKDRDKYFKHPLFKDRVEPDFSMLAGTPQCFNSKECEDAWVNNMFNKVIGIIKTPPKVYENGKCIACENTNILLEFMTVRRANQFYDYLQELKVRGEITHQVLLITSDTDKYTRQQMIKTVKESRGNILIGTQVLEAGVDIDMDLGFKEISMLDAEEQFIGRINRSCKKIGSKVYFFSLGSAITSKIYEGDYRINKSYTLQEEKMQQIFKLKDFDVFYEPIMKQLRERKIALVDLDNKGDTVLGFLRRGSFKQIEDEMKLIKEDHLRPYTIFVNRDIEIEQAGEKITLIGSDVWQEYKQCCLDFKIDYAKKKVKILQIMEKMSYFTWDVARIPGCVECSDRIGETYYVATNVEELFTNGRFNRELFK